MQQTAEKVNVGKMPRRRGRPSKKELKKKEQGECKIITITPVFKCNKESDSRVIINRGGAGSSKSYSIAQILVERFFSLPKRKILIVRKTLPSIRISTIPVIKGIIGDYGLWGRITEERQLFNFWYRGSLIHFSGLDDPEKIKSTEWNDVWMEEATEFTYDDYINLYLRQRCQPRSQRNQMFLSFNPVDEYHWIKTQLIDPRKEDITEIHSSFKDNPFLPADYIASIKSLMEQDQNYYRIFGLGEWGRLEHVIYNKWSITETVDAPGNILYGLDFGFNNPTALTKVTVDGFEAHLHQIIYESNLTNQALINKMKELIPEKDRGNYPIYADSAEPQRIEEINNAGFWCLSSDKAVIKGIDTVKKFKLQVSAESPDVQRELQSYSWRADKNKKILDEPVKFNDHAMDSVRYALHTYYTENVLNMPNIRMV